MHQVTPIQFFQMLFGELAGPGCLVIWTRTTRGGECYAYWPNNLDEAARQACQYAKSRDVWFCVSLQDPEAAMEIAKRRRPRIRQRRVRGSEHSATVLPALWVELEFAAPGQSPGRLPPDRESILGLLAAVPRPPSIVVRTGRGVIAFWRLREPLPLATPEARQTARNLVKKLHAAARSAAAEHGWELDQSASLARLLRVPGTLDHGSGQPVTVTVEHSPLAVGPLALKPGDWTYAPEDFDDLPEPDAATGTGALMRDPGAHRDRRPAADFGPVFAGCPYLRYCWDERSGLPEEELRAVLTVIVHCRVGDAGPRRLGHRYTRDHPGYTAASADAEIDLALAAAGPRTCEQLGELGAHAAACCVGWAASGRAASGRAASGRAPSVVDGTVPRPTGRRPTGPEPARPASRPLSVLTADQLARSRVVWIGVLDPADGHPLTEAAAGSGGMLRDLVRGLGEVLESLGGAATSREILDQLDAERGRRRYPGLCSALAELFPNLDAEALPTPVQLSALLGSIRDRPAGGARIERQPRHAQGLRWRFRRVEEASS